MLTNELSEDAKVLLASWKNEGIVDEESNKS